MSLAKYREKRSFDQTPEPQGGKTADTALRFVIQKHDASHLHYDFRLEMGGVLKSWAVPKGPSLNPADKRLAMMVEDHPYDYRNFEGIIPEGNYGAGTVIVWDEGYYEPLEKVTGKKAQERELMKELKDGSLKFVLHGKKLKGEFALVKTKGMAENAWLLIKHKDRYAAEVDVTRKDKSVISKKTIAQMSAGDAPVYGSKTAAKKSRKKATAAKEEVTEEAEPESKEGAVEALAAKGKKKAFYTTLKPMLATLVDKPFDEPGWIYEIKWDGYRAVSFLKGGKVTLKSRNNISFEDKFRAVYEALKAWKADVIVDGEIVALNEEGIPDFELLQNWSSNQQGQLVYYLFDLLWLDGKDITQLPLSERRQLLQSILPESDYIRFSDQIDTTAAALLQEVKKKGMEGIMAKRADSIYKADFRTKDWVKIKDNHRQEMVIGGFTRNVDTSKPFSALLMGVHENGKFIFTGKVGTGFSIALQKELLKKMQPLVTGSNPFEPIPKKKGHALYYPKATVAETFWLKPKLVAEVAFTEMTQEHVMRHPAFIALREDKASKEVKLEKAAPVKAVTKSSGTKTKAASKTAEKKELIPKGEDTATKRINGHTLTFSNLDKWYWPDEKISKRDLINYYHEMADFILPYLKDRPQSLNRTPDGVNGESFYQKDVTGKAPDWADLFPYRSEGDQTQKNFLLGNNEATLLYMAGLGCIEMNPWSSTIRKPDYPTWCIIDLDPGKNTFDQVIEAALVTHNVLEAMEVAHYVKTSGSTGMHIYIPLNAKYTYEQSKEFARLIVTLVQRETAAFTSLERSVKDRKGKMYLDFLQNRDQATLAAPYSVRPKPGATVSMPLHWEEVKKGLQMKDFTLRNVPAMVRERGDIFKPVLGKGIDMIKALQKAADMGAA